MTANMWMAVNGAKVYLDEIARTHGLAWESTFPGGDGPATCTLDLPTEKYRNGFTPGVRCGITVGGQDVWSGILDAPEASERHTITATGDGTLPRWYVAFDTLAGNAYNINSIVDACIARGLPLTRDTIPALAGASAQTGTMFLSDALDFVSAGLGRYWHIDRSHLAFFTDNTGLVYQLVPSEDVSARTLDGYASTIYASFINSSTALRAVSRGDTSGKIVQKEGILDLTAGSTQLSATETSTALAVALNRQGKRANSIGDFALLPGQVLSAGGQVVNLATVRAGFVARVQAVNNDVGEPYGSQQSFVAGRVRYDQDSETLNVSVLDAQARNTRDVLAQIGA